MLIKYFLSKPKMNDENSIEEFIKIEIDRRKHLKNTIAKYMNNLDNIYKQHVETLSTPPPIGDKNNMNNGNIIHTQTTNSIADNITNNSVNINSITSNTDNNIATIISTTDKNVKYNIPIADSFLKTHCLPIDLPKQPTTPLEKSVHIKLIKEINKRLIQVNTKRTQMDKVSASLSPYVTDPYFNTFFVKTVLEQGRIQVEKHNESYTSYSYIICKLFSAQLFTDFKRQLFTLDSTKLYGVYSIYFGVLKFKGKHKEAMDFVRAINFETQNVNAEIVVEAFMSVLGPMLMRSAEEEFKKVCAYFIENVVGKMKNPGCAERVKQRIKQLDAYDF